MIAHGRPCCVSLSRDCRLPSQHRGGLTCSLGTDASPGALFRPCRRPVLTPGAAVTYFAPVASCFAPGAAATCLAPGAAACCFVPGVSATCFAPGAMAGCFAPGAAACFGPAGRQLFPAGGGDLFRPAGGQRHYGFGSLGSTRLVVGLRPMMRAALIPCMAVCWPNPSCAGLIGTLGGF